MKPLYTQEEFNNSKSFDTLLCECEFCKNPFSISKHRIQQALNPNHGCTANFCSKVCQSKAQITKVVITCVNCLTTFERQLYQIKKSKNNFCSTSCAVTYNNKNKTTGTRRSKLEAYLESTLTTLYPTTEFHFNRKDAIGSELDIYIPNLRLAFELNGIFHCEPIFGQNKLDQIQSNDDAKFKACHDNNITLCMIDTSKQKYFKESTSKEFLDIILYHINFIGLVKSLANSQ